MALDTGGPGALREPEDRDLCEWDDFDLRWNLDRSVGPDELPISPGELLIRAVAVGEGAVPAGASATG